MQLTISGRESEIGVITFSEIDFGKKLNDREERFTLTVSGDDFINPFGPIYAECVTELIRDDEITGQFHPPYGGAVRYPAFDEFLSMDEHQRMEMIDTYFVFDILRLYFREDAYAATAQWNIKSLDSLQLSGGILSIGGRLATRS